MNNTGNVKSIFSIKDLENISGIKAHTIRIWEKRYNVLEPMRSSTNIRNYDILSLKKLLNIVLLHEYGYKISRISEYPDDKLDVLVKEIVSTNSSKSHAIKAFKMAMINFDQALFLNTYNQLLSEKTFREVFFDVFIPLLNEVGLLWQTGTITPAQEHFISFLIKQKLLVHTEKLQALEPTKKDKVFVLYLPDNEIHELGLMYLNYEILMNGYKAIYLGESVPIDSLKSMKTYFDSIVFISYMTIKPLAEEMEQYVLDISNEVMGHNSQFWMIGKMAYNLEENQLPPQFRRFSTIPELVSCL